MPAEQEKSIYAHHTDAAYKLLKHRKEKHTHAQATLYCVALSMEIVNV